MAVFNEPTKWQTSLVNSGDANTIPQNTPAGTGEASFEEGFPQITQIPLSAGGQAPDRKDFNGLFKVLGDWIFFNQNGGVSTYSENFDYVAGRVVLYNDNIYKCIQANGVSSTVVTPDSDTAYWQRLDNFVRSVNGVNADASGNVKIETLDTSLFMPDYENGINLTIGTNYTAPCDGYVVFTSNDVQGGIAFIHLSVLDTNNKTIFSLSNGNHVATACNAGVSTLLPKGYKCSTLSSLTKNTVCTFYPLKGAN